ncbi:MAG: NAD-dependent epimerase/dehydratase family protein [Methylomonas sp.]|jgi:nucleoside-diphosphate-sugar epimerase|uniref:NAD-dependent epimerase/dehydratase family protein n=1 Tax=Methylomonas sp. TaxID=418 RepID=UPI0025E4788D|nr:NAD-dependent epimerase/dehydratase family protein [Methylomonas sp.]MCK9607877.1 NAD-dependent epimerase/dehydratase family protein [Methylomonas sp.]
MKDLVVVSGAGGFIGANLCASLQQAGYQVRQLNHRQLNEDKRSYVMDLANDPCPSDLLQDVHAVFHLAGKAHALAENQQDEAEYYDINTEGTRKLLEAAKHADVQRFVYFSSVKAVGDCDDQPMDESVQTPADTPYGRSKFAAEQLVLHGGYVPHPVVIRPSMVYGNTEKGNLPRMIQAIRRGVFPPLPETNNRRSMVHVEDVVQAALLAAEMPQAAGQIYIVTDDNAYSTRQIYDWIRAALGKSPQNWQIPMNLLTVLAKTGDTIGHLIGRRFPFDSDALDKLTGSAWYSSAKIQRELGFRPRHSLQTSLADMVHFLNF